MFEVRSIYLLRREEIIELARQRAECGESMEHGFAPGSAQAFTFERAYNERRRELDFLDSELV